MNRLYKDYHYNVNATKYVNVRKIIATAEKCNAKRTMIVGVRSNGKSEGVKRHCIATVKQGLKNNLKTYKYCWLRRTNKTSIKNGREHASKYDNMYMIGNSMYLGEEVIDEQGNSSIENGLEIGRYIDLWNVENIKSGYDWNDYKYLVFDEFIQEHNQYLVDEANKYASLEISVDRNRSDFKVIMIANTVNVDNPYFHKYGITKDNFPPINVLRFYYKTKTLVAHIGFSAELQEEIDNNPLYAGLQDTRYVRYAIMGQWLKDDSSGIMNNKPKNLMYQFSVAYENEIYDFHLFDGKKWWINLNVDKKYTKLFVANFIESQKYGVSFTDITWLKNAYISKGSYKYLFWKNYEVKNMLNELFLKKLK